MQKLTLMGVLAVLCLSPRAQQPALKPLSIGDTVPDITITNVYNYPSSTIRLSDLKGKLVILDFWATWCSACIREFPKLDSLQTRFNDSLQLFLISSAGSNEIKDILQFFEKHFNPDNKKYTFPFTANDTTLIKLFPHISIPHIVWLYNAKIVAITDGEEISAANIHQVLQNKPAGFDMKQDIMDFDPSRPLLSEDNGGKASTLIRRSVFTNYLKGMGSRVGKSTEDGGSLQRIYFINQPILKLYAIAVPGIAANRLLLEIKDTDQLINTEKDDHWKDKNCYSYELTLSAAVTRDKIHATMLQDLNRQFGFNTSIQKRRINCFALVIKTKPGAALKPIAPESTENKTFNKSGIWLLNNQPLSVLINALNYQVPALPLHSVVLDETNYTLPVHLELKVNNIQDISAVKKALHPYGLDIIRVVREVDMLVISPGLNYSELTPFYSKSN